MHIARKLVLLCAMAVAAMAFAASTASAEPITVVNEETGQDCERTNCEVHVVGEATLDAFHLFRVSTCEDEFVAQMADDGTGDIITYNNTATHAGQNCTRRNCGNGVGDEASWPITGAEETATNAGQMVVRFCLEQKSDGLGDTHCNAPVSIVENGDHSYVFDVNTECSAGGVPVEVDGTWTTESVHDPLVEDEIEVVHQ